MLTQTKRISFRISSVLSKVEPETDLHTGSGSDKRVPAPTGSGSATLRTTAAFFPLNYGHSATAPQSREKISQTKPYLKKIIGLTFLRL